MSIDLGKGIPYAPLRRQVADGAGQTRPDGTGKSPEVPSSTPAEGERPSSILKRNILLAVALAVAAFFWIWLFEYTGARAYWVALVALAVCLAVGPTTRSLPYLVLSGAGGVLLGLVTFAVSMLVLPLYYGLSWAIAGALILLVAGLLSLPMMRETLPMLLVGWGCFLGAVARYDYLFLEKPVEVLPTALGTFAGVLLSVMVGVLLSAALGSLVPKGGRGGRAPAAAGSSAEKAPARSTGAPSGAQFGDSSGASAGSPPVPGTGSSDAHE